RDSNLQIIARTDARAVLGFEAAIERAYAYIEAGADLTFVEAPTSVEEIEAIAKLPVPQLVNVVFGGRTPMLPIEQLRAQGFAIVLYANAALQAAIKAVYEVLGHLHRTGSLAGVEERLASFEERQRLVGKDAFDELEAC